MGVKNPVWFVWHQHNSDVTVYMHYDVLLYQRVKKNYKKKKNLPTQEFDREIEFLKTNKTYTFRSQKKERTVYGVPV